MAAAITYSLDEKSKSEPCITICDFEGGTFDVSINAMIATTAGDTHLGGEDFNNCVIEYFVKQYKMNTTQMSQPTFVRWESLSMRKSKAYPFLSAIYSS